MEAHEGVYFAVLPPKGAGDAEASLKKAPPFPGSLGFFDLQPTIGVAASDIRIDQQGCTWTLKLPQPLRTPTLRKFKEDLGDTLAGQISALADIMLSEHEKAELGVPKAASRFAWCHPTASKLREHVTSNARLMPLLRDFKDADLCFLVRGGFVYFDDAGGVLQLLALVSSSLGQGVMAFGRPQQWLPEWTAQLGDGRFVGVTTPELKKAGVTHYTWITPNEEVAGVKLCPHGGFAYLLPGGSRVKSKEVNAALDNTKAQESIAAMQQMRRILKTFQRFDKGRDGVISTDMFLTVFDSISVSSGITKDAVKKLVDAADKNGDGSLNYIEFLGLCFGHNAEKMEEAMEGVEETEFNPTNAVAAISRVLPSLPRVCILGGRSFQNPLSEVLVQKAAALCGKQLAGKALVITGGMPGVQETFVRNLGPSVQAVQLLPVGQSSNYGCGKDLAAGMSLEERMAIFGELGDIYLSIEGGPGVAKEARAAAQRGAFVVPVQWTGGASGGMFDFPTASLQCPKQATKEEWSRLQEKGERSDDELVAGSSEELVKLLGKLLEECAKSQR